LFIRRMVDMLCLDPVVQIKLRKENIGIHFGMNLSQIYAIRCVERSSIDSCSANHEGLGFSPLSRQCDCLLDRPRDKAAVGFEVRIASNNDGMSSGQRLADRFECLAADDQVVSHSKLAKPS